MSFLEKLQYLNHFSNHLDKGLYSYTIDTYFSTIVLEKYSNNTIYLMFFFNTYNLFKSVKSVRQNKVPLEMEV